MKYHDQNGIRVYTIGYPKGESGALTSDEIGIISRLIRERLDHAVSNGFTDSADVLVQFVYTGVTPSYRYNNTKSMNSFLIRKFDNFVALYQQYVDLSLPPNDDYVHEIIEIRIKVVKPSSGGCWPNEKTEKIEAGVKRKRPKSTNNNCFFRCLEKIIPGLKPTVTYCDTIRKAYGLPPKTPIPLPIAWDLIQRYQVPVGLCCPGTGVHYNRDAQQHIELADGHYSLITEQEKRKCDSCGEIFYGVAHICPVVCSACGTRYKKKHTCSSAKSGYYKAVIQKKGRYLIRKTRKARYGLNPNVIHYDIETYTKIVDGHEVHTPYILGFVGEEGVFRYYAGDDCVDNFVRYLMSKISKDDSNLVLNAYNGSNFDHYFLIKSMNKLGLAPEKFIMNNGSIIGLQKKGGEDCRSFRCFDLMKHIGCSLKQALSDFGCAVQKGDFDHSKACRWEDMSDSMREECLLYLQSDVLGLQELFNKLNNQCYKDFSRDITDFISTSSLGFDIWRDHIPEGVLVDLSDSTEMEKNIRKSIYGGRCYKSKTEFVSDQYEKVLEGECKYEDVSDFLLNMDVVSLYPTSMLHEYPVGQRKYTSGNEMKGKMGIYKVKYVSNKGLLHPVVARKDEKGATKWDLLDSEGWYTSIDIDQMIKYGYQVEIIEGYYWEETSKVFYDYIQKVFQLKQNSPKGSVQYTLAKLLMNGLYGKMIQRPIYINSQILRNHNEYWKFHHKYVVTDLTLVSNTWYVSGYLRSEVDSVDKISKPSHYGAFVLAYSHKIMYDHMTNLNPENKVESDFYYTDTDSLHIPGEQEKLIPNYNVAQHAAQHGNNLGDLANDYKKDAKIIKAVYIAPKLYMTITIDTDNAISIKTKGKGLNKAKLTQEDFQKMLQGKVVINIRDFSMKKVHLKRTSKEQGIDHFSIIHIRNLERCANKKEYKGRIFLDKNKSFPIGYKNTSQNVAQHDDPNTTVLPLEREQQRPLQDNTTSGQHVAQHAQRLLPFVDRGSQWLWQNQFAHASAIQTTDLLRQNSSLCQELGTTLLSGND